MSKSIPYIAAYDLDKTILTVNSSQLIVTTSRRMGIMSQRDFLQAIYYSIVYKLDLKDPNKIVNKMTRWLKGLKESEVIDLITEHAVPVMIALIRPEIIDTIAEHRKNRAKIIILSSALSHLCEPIAKYLGMDDLISSKLEIIDGVFTGNPESKLVFGKEKAVRMKEYCSEHHFDLNTAYYYGDAWTDHFVLESVGNPVCVQPEMKLRAHAKEMVGR